MLCAAQRHVSTLFVSIRDDESKASLSLLQLNKAVRRVQHVVKRHDGFFRQLVVDDKGCVSQTHSKVHEELMFRGQHRDDSCVRHTDGALGRGGSRCLIRAGDSQGAHSTVV